MLALISLSDAYILQRSKLARVTAVARSNYDVVNGEPLCRLVDFEADPIDSSQGHTYQEQKVWHSRELETLPS